MFKKLNFIVMALLICQTFAKSQTSEQPDSAVPTLGFSTYVVHTDKYASGFDIYSNSQGFTYVVGNTKTQDFFWVSTEIIDQLKKQ